jgi:hypothetical protein
LALKKHTPDETLGENEKTLKPFERNYKFGIL